MASGNDREIRIGVTAETSGAEEARKALEGVRRAAEEAAAASGEVRPLEGGAGGPRVDAKSVEEVTDAILEQAEANGVLIDSLDELTDAEAGVVRSTGKVSEEFKKLSEEARKPEGFGKLFSPERMEGIKSSFGELGKAVGEFAKEFSKTEEGQKLLEGLSDETKVFGETALGVANAAAQGFAAGGPVGAAVSGLAALVKQVGDEYLDAQERIEASNRELAQAEAEYAERREEKRRAGASREIEEQLRRENDELDDQNEELRENAALMKSRADVARAEFDLKQAQDEAAGKSKDEMEVERIQFDLQEKDKELTKKRWDRQVETNIKDSAAVKAEEAARKEGEANGTKGNAKYDSLMEEARRARETSDDDKRAQVKDLEQIENERKVAQMSAATGLTRLSTRAKERAERDGEREKEKGDREKDQKERARKSEAARVRDIGHDADGISSKAAGIAEKRLGKGRGVEALDKIGAALRDDPTAKELESLTELLTQLASALDRKGGGDSRAIRDLQKEVRDLQGKLTKGGDAVHR